MRHIFSIAILVFFISNNGFAQKWTGVWSTDFGALRIHEASNTMYGDYADKGIIDGYEKYLNTYKGTFTNGADEGWFEFKLNGEKFTGTWGWKGQGKKGNWNGRRISKEKPLLTSKVITGTWESHFGDVLMKQQGLTITGTFKNGGSLSGQYDVSTKKIKGSMYIKNQSHPFYLFKKPRTEGLWVGKYQPAGSNEMNGSWFLKAPKVPSTAKFKSDTGVAVAPMNNGGNVAMNTSVTKVRSSAIRKPKKTKEEIEGAYLITLTRLLCNYDFPTVINESEIEMYGSMTIRLFGEGQSGRAQIRPSNNQADRVFEASKNHPLIIPQKGYTKGGVDCPLHKDRILYRGEVKLDRARMFKVKGELANSNLEFVVTQQLNVDRAGKDFKREAMYGKLKVDDVKFGQEYFTVLDLDRGHWVGFIIEKVN